MNRDKRWENVSAHVSVPQGYFYEDENDQFNVADFLEFLIEVRWDNQVFYSRILLHKDDLEDARLPMYKYTLDKMVEQIDLYIKLHNLEEL